MFWTPNFSVPIPVKTLAIVAVTVPTIDMAEIWPSEK